MRTAMLRECGFATLDAMLIAIYSHSNRRFYYEAFVSW
jgi:hypothetical protein